jgi:hypothetical protein
LREILPLRVLALTGSQAIAAVSKTNMSCSS